MMQTYISLNKQVDCNNICKQAKLLLDRFLKEQPNTTNAILVITINTVISDQNEQIPKLEHKS
jgi:hypothetical protein